VAHLKYDVVDFQVLTDSPVTWPARISQLDFFGDFRDISWGNNFLNFFRIVFRKPFVDFRELIFKAFLSLFETAFGGIFTVTSHGSF